jgi:glycosyltransferase involved in cell wall biosynthesis
MFSVIIPLYNKSAYIEKCLLSVLDQTFQQFEVIVVNDGSSDDSLEIVKSFIKRVKNDELNLANWKSQPERSNKIKIIDQKNSGVSIARNNGVNAAKYDYIAFLDADDWWDSHFLDEMKSLIQEFPDAGIYGSLYYCIKNKRLTRSVNHEPEGFKGYIDYFKAYNFKKWMPLNSSTVLLPKKVFYEFDGFKASLKFAEDFDLWLRIALKYKIGYLNKPLSFYNQDVVISQRAVGSSLLYKPSDHVIFNLDYLIEEEKRNSELKKLLDYLRVNSLIDYRLSGKYIRETSIELAKVDFTKQPAYYKRIYSYPTFLVKGYFSLLKKGSRLKQYLLKLFINHLF